MPKRTKVEKRGPGRPSTKIRLKADPKVSKEKYYKRYGELGVCCVYGVDTFTEELIDYLWKKPDISFVVTDPIEATLSNATRKYGARSFSLYRWEAVHHQGFIEQAKGKVVVVAKAYHEAVKKLPNPNKVEIVMLEDL